LPTEPHLVLDLSGHGYGHAAMSVPVLNAISRRRPRLKLTIRTTVPVQWLTDRIAGRFDVVQQQSDFGMMMANARTVLPEETLATYNCIHANWPARITAATEELAAIKPTLVVSNISYLSLAAAKHLGFPSIAFGSLNWADIFHHYCSHLPGSEKVWTEMVESYAAAEKFLQTTPCMPMPSIHNGYGVGPVAEMGFDRKPELRRRLNLGEEILVLIAVRGMPKEFSLWNWPRLSGMRVILGPGQNFTHPDVICSAVLGVHFLDLVRSCDVLITKPGYGLITEAACNGTPVLLLPWKDWPETVGLTDWLSQHGRMLRLSDEKLSAGDFATEVHRVLALPTPPRPLPTGVSQIAEIIEAHLPSA
jgi:hypothetical protein